MKSKIEDYRNGAMGALLDEYEKALDEILPLFNDVSQDNFIKIMDPDTEDEDCRSMQSIMWHVINAGYGYCLYIRTRNGENIERIRVPVDRVDQVEPEARKMFEYVVSTAKTLKDYPNYTKFWDEFIFKAPWGEIYNLEQIMEHAVVHILRHRRQIEKFILMQKR